MDKVIFSRAELYDLVWSKSILSLSTIYDVPQSALRNACIKNSIPLPKQGHWEKIKAGHVVERLPLLNPSEEAQIVEVIKSGKKTEATVKQELEKKIGHKVEKVSQTPVKGDEIKNIVLDPLIQRIQKQMKLTAKEYPRMDLIYGRELDIKVSSDTIDRAMHLMNTVINWVKSKGYRISNKHRETCIIIYRQEVGIKLRERTIRASNREHSLNSFDYKPTGKLYFKIGRWWSEVEYKEGAKLLEEQLPVMFARMELIAKEKHELHLKHETEREEERRLKELQKQKEDQCEKELSDFKELLQKSERWYKSQILREYIISWEKRIGENVSEKVLEKINWARQKADWYDPFIDKFDELLESVDRDTLLMEKEKSYWDY